VTSQFAGTTGMYTRPNNGTFCGSLRDVGYRTLSNDQQTANAYVHSTFDVSDNVQLYGDLLYNYDEQKYSAGSNYTWWGTGVDYGAYWDPNLGDFVNLQRVFSPEDVGGYKSIMDKQYDNSYMLTFGAKGTFGESNWDYDLGFTHSDDHLRTRSLQRMAGPIDAYFEQHVLGPQQGFDPYYNYYPVFTPDYAAFYTPMSPADFRSFMDYTTTKAKTWDNMLRGQLTNASLFSLPGGDAGVAFVVEGGNQGWAYTPDPRLLDGSVWGTTDVQGAGHRSRYAATTELSMPLFSMLTVDISGRYDNYHVADENVHHGTYNIGLEFRPWETLLLRGKYGTAFKAATLPDEFQGESGYYDYVIDYYNCAQLGFTGGNIDQCPRSYHDTQFFGVQSGNTSLQPITAKVWSYGVVWSPLDRMKLSVDYLHWDISNEVTQQSSDELSNQDYLCRTGQLDANSPTCVATANQVTRDNLGNIVQIYTPKVNVSKERVNAITADFGWIEDIGSFGHLTYNLSYSNVLSHKYQQYTGDEMIDVLRNPYYSTDFRTKFNGSITWSNNTWSATLYANRYGSTPNYAASQSTRGYAAANAGRLAPWVIYNASVTYNATPALGVSLMVDNVFNKMPPIDRSYPGSSGTPFNTSNYNVYGRAYYVEASYKFGK
jgi:outer membrane receptor protein involved in Fe transport